ncbi:tRNA-5-carboxymethylaminomethyl-2-thiouridine(34)synthesis protein MnmE [Olavius algarvensis spirochete endosymbiont]|uniref:tRNA uridine-5-carboxymethylaminomethyl(34) synthesis GTPase MnmE n=1 Tax=Olavius algarvensis spirochete endosymbiont TaxID=260710 RepID=UPI000F2397AB|nr:tRNA uridine-5-carboxymethylaminomethyl(34) synthesis GTPase MnmE [Olavius algarvensis spirochete endosymbiont]CAD7840349.1 MAG: tRNA-5-carboxymethylaminomethyl-2-thiouridine(34) synthesis protein MnmE [Olavius algarvensis spirochete endosymbiont]VDB01185.1 tRNA-5-carboxymethylaminomethyl-2-thiouridine(34)synthesis protein MnmE [Olavius algarvensis spirochete endosymbiont]
MMEYNSDDLIAALATVRGRSAIAVIRTSGFGCVDAIAKIFSRPKVLVNSEGNRVCHGWLLRDDSEKIDEVLLTVFRGPLSYTGEDSVEISCHGGLVISDVIMNLLRSIGFRDAAPGEFSFRAFFNGKMDLTQAEAVREIIEARTDRGRALALSRLGGSVRLLINAVLDGLKKQAAIASLALDYPEDEVERIDFDLDEIRFCRESLERLVGTWRTGRLYQEGIKVTLAGPVNAGKSSLFNLFLREERSIVTEKPGTTRDWVEAWVNHDGIPMLLIDTAGLRTDVTDAVEMEGIRRTRELIASSDLVVALADGAAGHSRLREFEQLGLEVEDGRLIRVWNKVDLAPDAPPGWIGVSAKTGVGFSDLITEISFRAAGATPERNAPVINSARQRTLLLRAIKALDNFRVDMGIPIDLLAEDLHEALDALGELVGAVKRTDVLDLVFSNFCVGK